MTFDIFVKFLENLILHQQQCPMFFFFKSNYIFQIIITKTAMLQFSRFCELLNSKNDIILTLY